jgi:hypothetical protein
LQNRLQPQNQDKEILHPPTTKLTKTKIKAPNPETDTQNQPKTQKADSARPTPRAVTHATFSYPPLVETFFDDDTDHDSQHEPRHIPVTSPVHSRHPLKLTSRIHQLKTSQRHFSNTPRMPTFANWPTQPIFKHDVNISTP